MRRSVFVFAILLLVSAALYAFASMWMALARLDRLDDTSDAMLRAEETRTIVQAFLASTVNIETATRGFVLYADPALLTPFEDARSQAPRLLDQLRDHVRDEPTQLSRLDRVTQQLAQSISLAELLIERKRAGAGPSAEMTEFGDRAMATTKAIRALLDEIDSGEIDQVALARAAWKAELRQARSVEIAMGALILGVILLAAWVLARLRRLGTAESAESASDGPTVRNAAAEGATEPSEPGSGSLADALRELARRDYGRGALHTREAIDDDVPPLDPARAQLLHRAAQWAAQVFARRPCEGEIEFGLARAGDLIEVRVADPCQATVELTDAERTAHDGLAAEFATAGGTWDWRASDGHAILIARLPPRSLGPADGHMSASSAP